ncbi:hypothetical protein LB505_013983 [Fusarium chuoi]|nr:hypothetical protein LB505_013983 [Fusarium chuoi]
MNRFNLRPSGYVKEITRGAQCKCSYYLPKVRSFYKQSTSGNIQSPGALTGLKVLDVSRVMIQDIG